MSKQVAPVCFVDCETTGLDPERHEIWEVGLIVDGTQKAWMLPVEMALADPMALAVGGFHQRHQSGLASPTNTMPPTHTRLFAQSFGRLTYGRHLVGAVVSFDAAFLTKLLRAEGVLPAWHYHLVDVEALVAGMYGIVPPWDSESLSRLVGVDPSAFERHTALGDARWAQAMYDAVMAKGAKP